MLALRRRRTLMSGVAIVVVLVMLATSVIMGAGLWFFSVSTHQQVARASFSTAAEYLCEAACEEGFYIAQRAMNEPDYPDPEMRPLYGFVRTPQPDPFKAVYRPVRLLKHLQTEYFDEVAAQFPADGIEAEMEVAFDAPFSPLCPTEYQGIMTFRASVAPRWGGGKRAYRRVEVRRAFKVVLVTPPHPFDKSALTLHHPDYINGEAKAALVADIFEPTNRGIDEHNKVCDLYKNTIKTAKDTITCPSCKELAYISGSPPFFAPHIPESAKIPLDFFHDDSLLLGSPDREKFGKMVDFNYEDIIREYWPPLYAFFQTLLAVATTNGALLVVTTALLAVINDAMEALPYVGQVIAVIHKALKVIVPIQIVVGQIVLAAQKIVMEGLIVGQLFYAIDQALQGNFAPVADGVATFGTDVAQSGVLDNLSSGQEEMGGISDTAAQGGDTFDGVVTTGEDGATTVNQGRIQEIQDSMSNNPSAFEGKFDGMKDLENFDGNKIRGLGDQLTGLMGGSGATSGVGPMTEMAADSDMSMLTGLIKGFVDSHRKFYTLEFPSGTAEFTFLDTMWGLFDESLWRAKATMTVGDGGSLAALLDRYRNRGLCGVVFHDGDQSLDLSLRSFKGKLILYSRGPITVSDLSLNDDKVDSVTLITPGSITLGTAKVQGSLNAVGDGGEGVVFGASGSEVFGNILMNRYVVDSQRDRRSNDRALKGELTLNPRLDQREDDGTTIKPSHLRVIVSPGILSQEVFATP